MVIRVPSAKKKKEEKKGKGTFKKKNEILTNSARTIFIYHVK